MLSLDHKKEILESISQIEKIISKHELEKSKKREVYNAIEDIKKRFMDSKLYLGIIGEFSSGKSTFINSLLRDDLLTTSTSQATTCSATYIRYLLLQGIAASVKLKNGKKEELIIKQGEGKDKFFDFIDKYAAEERYADQVEKVELFYPFEGIRDDIVIIDTPGVTVNNPRHIRVTEDVVKNVCDSFVVIISADTPLNRSLKQFLAENVGESLFKCIFVVTKLDIYKQVEQRKKIFNDVVNRLKSDLKIANPKVYPMSSIVVMEKLYKEGHRYDTQLHEKDKQTLYNEYLRSEAAIRNILKQHRLNLQYEKLIRLIDTVYSEIIALLTELETRYSERQTILMDKKIMDFGVFIKEQNDSIEKSVDDLFKNSTVLKEILQSVNDIYKQICEKIDGYKDCDDLKKYLTDNLQEEISSIQPKITGLVNKFQNKVQKTVKSKINKFEVEFKKNYQMLSTLALRLQNTKLDISSQITATDITSNISGAYPEGTVDALGGVSVWSGGVLGQLVIPVPVVGFIIGMVAGAVAGSWLVNTFKLPSIKEDCKKKVLESIQAYYDTLSEKVVSELSNYWGKVSDDCDSIMNNYYEKYNALLTEIIKQHNEESKMLIKKRENVSKDTEQLKSRQKIYEKIRKEIYDQVVN